MKYQDAQKSASSSVAGLSAAIQPDWMFDHQRALFGEGA